MERDNTPQALVGGSINKASDEAINFSCNQRYITASLIYPWCNLRSSGQIFKARKGRKYNLVPSPSVKFIYSRFSILKTKYK